ncbi:MAG: histidine phosphatase family protein [Methanosarcinales archaeon]|jgi:broad specificity phosphatase PhoE|nr:histidine phosphatase family protein [Methanosarcinales archaeon]
MNKLGKHCVVNKRTNLSESDEERVIRAVSLLQRAGIKGKLDVLGSGYESVVISDGETIYKVFDRSLEYYATLIKQLKCRFDGCKHFIPDLNFFTLDGKTILTYGYQPSEKYIGGRREEMQDFLVESALCGIVIKDIKPANFRVYDTGLKFIDYGWDIVPFNYKDFIFMVQRAYLSLNGWANPQFKNLAKRAINTWNLPQLEGFKDFFNETYTKLLNSKSMFQYDLLEIPENLWIKDVLNGFFENSDAVILDERLDFKIPNSFDFSSYPALDNKTAIIFDGPLNREMVLNLRNQIKEGQQIIFLFKNPFFEKGTGCSVYESLIEFFEKSGLQVLRTEQSPPRPDKKADFYSQIIAFETEAFEPCGGDTSLLIKTCYQDGGVLETLVKHIVSQLQRPDRFKEVLVVVDSKETDFLREYSFPQKREALHVLEKIKKNGLIDDYFLSPSDKDEILRINREWFAAECAETHCIRNIPVVPQLFGFEKCSGKYVLQVDCDSIVVRRDYNHRYLLDMKNSLEDQNAVSVSFNIAHSLNTSFQEYHSFDPSYVPEVRFCLFEKECFFSHRPYPNEVINGKLKYTWYRSVEIFQNETGLYSLRGGDPRTFYIHPSNNIKTDREFWFRVLERAEFGVIPEVQSGQVDLCGTLSDWLLPKRNENYIFIISGRNLSNNKFLRGWQSVLSQTRNDWGAVIINDNSDNDLHEFIKNTIQPFFGRITYIRNPFTKVILENIHSAIHNVCVNPYSVIVIMDMDDQLLTNDVLAVLHNEYLSGADMTAGTALKTSKGILPFIPDFKNPRNERMGDVWIHLRSFRKYMFDSIGIEFFKHEGLWIDKFNELTYTVPMAEMAADPRVINWPLYLWEPGHIRNAEHYQGNEISKKIVCNKPSYISIQPIRFFKGRTLPPGELLRTLSKRSITFIRHAEKEKINYQDSRESRTTERGQREASLWGENLPFKVDLFLTSTVERTAETAWCIKEGNLSEGPIIPKKPLGGLSILDIGEWTRLKNEFGFWSVIEKWISGEVSMEVAEPFNKIILPLLEDLWSSISEKNAENIFVVTHDHVIFYLYRLFYSTLERHRINYLGGFSVSLEEFFQKIIELKTVEMPHFCF